MAQHWGLLIELVSGGPEVEGPYSSASAARLRGDHLLTGRPEVQVVVAYPSAESAFTYRRERGGKWVELGSMFHPDVAVPRRSRLFASGKGLHGSDERAERAADSDDE